MRSMMIGTLATLVLGGLVAGGCWHDRDDEDHRAHQAGYYEQGGYHHIDDRDRDAGYNRGHDEVYRDRDRDYR